MARGGLQVGRPLEHNDRDGGSLAEADGQRNRASVALGSPGECALRWASVRECHLSLLTLAQGLPNIAYILLASGTVWAYLAFRENGGPS